MADRTVRGEIREVLNAAAEEMGFAVNSIRDELVEKGWFDSRDLTPEAKLWREGYGEKGIEGAQDFSRDDLYGRDPDSFERKEREPERDQDLER